MIQDWVTPAILGILLVASILAGLRIFSLKSGMGKGVGAAYLVLAGILVVFAATAGVLYWKRQMSQAMAPEK
ncbi:MAG: hypothetical protein FD180_1178 [Planctomycetota bacterium]|nr:MAG: hypothetical protein FD180_1178 [Planctomycetota bacterium]